MPCCVFAAVIASLYPLLRAAAPPGSARGDKLREPEEATWGRPAAAPRERSASGRAPAV